MLSFILLVYGFVATCTAAEIFTVPHVNITFDKVPRPFEIHVDKAFIEDTRQRVARTRAPDFIGVMDEGPAADNFTLLRNFWVDEYNWDQVEATINEQLKQFTILVEPKIDNITYQVPLHYVHHRSPRSDAIPLMFNHGWPGSFLEVSKIISNLTNPANTSLPAFHVVAASIPGYGLSPAPRHPGFGTIKTAHAFNELMKQLGYDKYCMQGGDVGAFIMRHQAALFPNNVVSVHCNFWIMQPEPNDLRRLAQGLTTPDEVAYINILESYETQGTGYRLMQQTQPLTLAYGLLDSPMANLMWIYALLQGYIDTTITKWSPEDIITWTMMYWIPGMYASNRWWKEMINDGDFVALEFGTIPPVKVPVAIIQFPHDLGFRMPLEWARREGNNVLRRTLQNRGGHFASHETPDALVADMQEWFGDKELSGTKIFAQ